MKARKATIKRKTSETDIQIEFAVDGKGSSKIDTQIPFLDHMLTLLAKHGLFDLKLKARGDLEVDIHHTNEDIGIALGQALGLRIVAEGVETDSQQSFLTRLGCDSLQGYLLGHPLPADQFMKDIEKATAGMADTRG